MRHKLSILLLCYCCGVFAQQSPPGNAVASAHPLATEAGMDILQNGGNAFDAAIAVSATLGVVEPYSSGFGGGGFWLLQRAADGKQTMIDGREIAPAAAHARLYRDANDEVIRGASINGPLAAGIPGMPAALIHLAEHYGELPLKKTLAAAIKHAERGFAVTPRYQKLMRFRQNVIKQYPETAAIFMQDGEIPQLGYKIVQPDLAKTIKAIAKQGRAGFYSGEVARLLVKGCLDGGGNWSRQDLRDYMIIERKPLVTNYKGIRIVSAPPPSSGGIALAQTLQILSAFDIDNMTAVQRKHHVVEAMRRAYRDRAVFLGDPDFVRVPTQRLLDKDYLQGLALTIDSERATPSHSIGDTPDLQQTGTDTTHFSVMDSDGNRVAATLSVNLPFGSGFVAPGTGVVFNNEMDDFSAKPGASNAYRLVEGAANAIAPGKRPLSSMTPTIIESEQAVGILGTPGGSRIISMVLLGVLDFAAGNAPQSWVSLRRYHHQYLPDVLVYEQHGMSAHEVSGLQALGHTLREHTRRYGNMQAIMWNKEDNTLQAASDPRGEGAALVK
ncbi:MAG: gamma-glutamyltransferase [Gammaproteobacteria bacterium]